MSEQERIALSIEHRVQKNAVSLLAQAIAPDKMEPKVKRLYEGKVAAVAAVEKRLKEVYHGETNQIQNEARNDKGH